MTAFGDSNRPPDFDPQRLRELASLWCDENLSDSEAEELQALLSAHPAALTMYVQYVNVHAGLDWEITSSESVAGLVPPLRSEPSHRTEHSRTAEAKSSDAPQRAAIPWKPFAIAAALLICAALAIFTRRPNNPQPQPGGAPETAQHEGALPAAQIATIKRLGPNAQWAVTPHAEGSPRELQANDVVCVTEGEIQVTFNCGAEVTLYAPAIMEALSPMKGRAIRGRMSANITDGPQGFTIETPQARVVDLGTIFGIEVGDEGATDVVVFKGAVDLHFDGRTSADASAPMRLTSGEAMRLDKVGTPSRIVSIDSDRFSSRPDDPRDQDSRPVLISAVTDNIDRSEQSWNYYEIVHGGMREDAKAFVDRVAHEWNGLFNTGMPKYLTGGDYVKTFNNDKSSRNIELFVTIDRPCRLYVLIDDRVPPPAWLTKQFHDTGDNIGLDVGPFYRVEDGVLIEDRLPGVGPGNLVDNVFSIWERKIDKPEVVHLGSNEADHRYINMYGIVATPLDAAPAE